MSVLKLLVLTSQQGALSTIYTKPPYAHNINSLDELEASGYPLLTRHEAVKVDLLDTDSVLYQRLKLHSGPAGSARKLAVKTGTVAAIMRSSNMEFDKVQAEVTIIA